MHHVEYENRAKKTNRTTLIAATIVCLLSTLFLGFIAVTLYVDHYHRQRTDMVAEGGTFTETGEWQSEMQLAAAPAERDDEISAELDVIRKNLDSYAKEAERREEVLYAMRDAIDEEDEFAFVEEILNNDENFLSEFNEHMKRLEELYTEGRNSLEERIDSVGEKVLDKESMQSALSSAGESIKGEIGSFAGEADESRRQILSSVQGTEKNLRTSSEELDKQLRQLQASQEEGFREVSSSQEKNGATLEGRMEEMQSEMQHHMSEMSDTNKEKLASIETKSDDIEQGVKAIAKSMEEEGLALSELKESLNSLREGIAEMDEYKGKVRKTTLYHHHEGSESGGGCYSIPAETEDGEILYKPGCGYREGEKEGIILQFLPRGTEGQEETSVLY